MIEILVVDDEENISTALVDVLRDEGYAASAVADGPAALRFLHSRAVDMVLLDIWLPGMGGMEVLKKIKEEAPQVAVVMISGHGTVNLAVEAIKHGAFDFIEKPLSIERLLLVVGNALRMRELEEENRSLRNGMRRDHTIIGVGPQIQAIRDLIASTAATSGRVLIYGENGTGKELIARNIHASSGRSKAPFIEVNCAAIPENLIESELFGHEKGAFTGAVESRKGKFELAHEGTIFLDEIADMSLPTQAKVLRVLQEMEMERVGGTRTIRVDVRVIAATNKDLREEIRKGNFREDLFYRLNVIPINVPPLRERKEDIPILVDYFLEEFCRLNGRAPRVLTPAARALFLEHEWPGNIRELRNMVERTVIMIQKETIDADELLPLFGERPRELWHPESEDYSNLKEARDAFEREYIRRKLLECGMNVSKTAKLLGIERSNLHRKINALQIDVLKEP